MARKQLGLTPAASTDAVTKAYVDSATTGIKVEDFGAIGNGTHDDTAALQAAFNAAENRSVYIDPAKVYAHSGVLTISANNVTVFGGGEIRATAENTSSFIITGDYITVEDVKFTCPTVTSRGDGSVSTLRILDCTGAVLRGVTVDGSKTTGVYVANSTNFLIDACTVQNTHADGFFIGSGSQHGVVSRCRGFNTGDDTFSACGWDGLAEVTDILFSDFLSVDSQSRGAIVAGATNIRYYNGRIIRPYCSGLYVASESTGTPAASNITFASIDIMDANTGYSTTTDTFWKEYTAVFLFTDHHNIDNVVLRDISINGVDTGNEHWLRMHASNGGTITNVELGTIGYLGTGPTKKIRVDGPVQYSEYGLPSTRFTLDGNATAVNRVAIGNSVTGSPVIIEADPSSSDTNVPITVQSKGTSPVNMVSNGGTVAQFAGNASPGNRFYLYNTASGGNYLGVQAMGSDTDINLVLQPKNAGEVQVYAGAGYTPTITALGADTTVALNVKTQNSAPVRINGNPIVTSDKLAINVKDYGAIGNGVADDTAAINAAIAALPAITGTFTETYSPFSSVVETRGGGTVLIPPGTYKISGPIILDPRTSIEATGATFVATSSTACLKLIQDPIVGLFSGAGQKVTGLTFDGAGVATNGFWIQSTTATHLNSCVVVRTTGDGYRLSGTQWAVFNGCTARECGGWGLAIGYNPEAGGSSLPDGNNNTFIRFFAESNTSGGVKLGAGAIGNTFVGLTSQYSPGIGILMTGSNCLANAIFNPHFENNLIHIQFDDPAGNNHVYSPGFWTNTATSRLVVCNGYYNIVHNPHCPASDPPAVRRAGKAACYEIGSTGHLTVENFARITGPGGSNFNTDGSLMFVNAAGAELDPMKKNIAASYVVARELSDPRQIDEKRFGKFTLSGTGATSNTLALRADADTQDRLLSDASGKLLWGSGTATGDTNLYRASADTLKTDDAFEAAGGLTVGGIAVPTISSTSTLTNKSVSLATNTLAGTTAQFNTALSDNDFATIAGSETLTNKTLTTPNIGAIRDVNGWTALTLPAAGGTVANYAVIANATTGNAVYIKAAGSDTNVPLTLVSQGTSAVNLQSNSGTVAQFVGNTTPGNRFYFYNTTSGNNYLGIQALGSDTNIGFLFQPQGTGTIQIYAPTTVTPTISAIGADSTVHLNLATKGGGLVKHNGVESVDISTAQTLTNKQLTTPKIDIIRDVTNNKTVISTGSDSAAVNGLTVWASNTGNGPQLLASGQDADAHIDLVPKGTGKVRINYVPAVDISTAQTLTNKTLTTPRIGGALTDTNGYAILYLNPASGTVTNYLTLSNTLTGGQPTLAAYSGTDTNVSVNIASQGSGVVKANNVQIVDISTAQTLTNKTLTTPVLNGIPTGTGVATAATVSTLTLRDTNANIAANAYIPATTSTVTAAGTTTLTIASTEIQVFTGSTTQTVKLPTTGVTAGQQYTVVNQSSGAVTVQSSGANTISTVTAGAGTIFLALAATPTTAAQWRAI